MWKKTKCTSYPKHQREANHNHYYTTFTFKDFTEKLKSDLIHGQSLFEMNVKLRKNVFLSATFMLQSYMQAYIGLLKSSVKLSMYENGTFHLFSYYMVFCFSRLPGSTTRFVWFEQKTCLCQLSTCFFHTGRFKTGRHIVVSEQGKKIKKKK